MTEGEQWYWDLKAKRAVQGADRGSPDDEMGPYESKVAAEAWKERVERATRPGTRRTSSGRATSSPSPGVRQTAIRVIGMRKRSAAKLARRFCEARMRRAMPRQPRRSTG